MLQHFRRQISLHITYCDVNRLSSLVETLKELTVLAEFCLQKVVDLVYVRWEERWGPHGMQEPNSLLNIVCLALGKWEAVN